jgi:hypothetical protein
MKQNNPRIIIESIKLSYLFFICYLREEIGSSSLEDGLERLSGRSEDSL